MKILSASVELNELVQGLRLRIGILEHPEQVFKQDDLAGDANGVVAGVAGPLHELAEERVVDDLRSDKVPPPRLPDVYRVEISRDGSGGVLVVVVG